jgi:fatty-acid desaturase
MQEPNWITKAKKTFEFHRSKLVSHNKWTMPQTAKALKRSVGGVSEDIMLIRWWKTHEMQLRRCDTAKEALEFIRTKKRAMDIDLTN